MSNLSVFNFESYQIRFVGTADKPWWVAADVCKVLELDDTSKAVSRLDDDEKLIRTLHVSGQGRETLCINESGLYSLVLTSRKVQAKRFKKWLTSEVIPAIRKTGSYGTSGESSAIVLRCPIEEEIRAMEERKLICANKIQSLRDGISELEAIYHDSDIRQAELYIEKYQAIAKLVEESGKKLAGDMVNRTIKGFRGKDNA